MEAQVNRHKNYLYTHEERPYLLGIAITTNGAVAHPCVRVPLLTRETIKGIFVVTYRPTRKVYTDARMFPGKQMPQREYRYHRIA